MAVSAKRLLVVFGMRPEAIKLFLVVAALRADPAFDRRMCVTGRHREILDQLLVFVGLVPDIDLKLMPAGQTLDGLTARLLGGSARCSTPNCPTR